MVWADVLKPLGAEVVATYAYDYYAGRPAITLHHVGDGHVLYVGAMGKQDLLVPLVRRLLEMGCAPSLLGAATGVEGTKGLEVVERRTGERRLLFVLNHSVDERSVDLDGEYTELLSSEPVREKLRLGSYDVAILEAEKGAHT